MTDSEVFEKLFNGGNFALPYLIKFTHTTAGTIRLVNNNESITYNNEIYSASSFEYNPPNNSGSGATLTISGVDNKLIEFINNIDCNYRLDVVGLIVENEVKAINIYTHYHGVTTINEEGEIEFQLDGDDRLEMTFPPYTYDTDNNRGNA